MSGDSPQRAALLVATSKYSDPTLKSLRSPVGDTTALEGVLTSVCGFDVRRRIDEPSYTIAREVGAFLDNRRIDDLLLLYFSCHGVLSDTGRLFYAAIDTDVKQPLVTAVPADLINELMDQSASRSKVLILDCCHSGAVGRGMSPKSGGRVDLREKFRGGGRVIITASTATEYAFEDDNITGSGAGSIFTSALVNGLATGAADLDRDGAITVHELFDYVAQEVRERTPKQTPAKWSFDEREEIVLARISELEHLSDSPSIRQWSLHVARRSGWWAFSTACARVAWRSFVTPGASRETFRERVVLLISEREARSTNGPSYRQR